MNNFDNEKGLRKVYIFTKYEYFPIYVISLSMKKTLIIYKIRLLLLLIKVLYTFVVFDTLTMNGKFHSVANGDFKLVKLFGALLVSVRVQLSICKI